jgi:hypothetical protein
VVGCFLNYPIQLVSRIDKINYNEYQCKSREANMKLLDTEGVSKEIAEFLRTAKSPALFAGAGVGAKANLPTWLELMEHLALIAEKYEEIETAQLIRKRYKAGHYLNAATIYRTCPSIPKGEIYNQVASKFNNAIDYKNLNALISLPFTAVFTTNYDRSLHDAYSEVARRASKTVELGDPTMRMALFNKDFYIARLHGRVEVPSSLILDEVDYRELLANVDYINLLVHIFTNYNCLFVGFSFSDPAITQVFDIIEKRFSPNFPSMHCALLPSDSNQDFIAKLAKLNIKTIYYDSSYNHFALWEGIKLSSREIPNEVKRTKPKPEFPLKPIQRFLATSYARLKMLKTIQPLRDVAIDGMLVTMLREANDNSITVSEVVNSLRDFLRIPLGDCEFLLKERIDYLVNEGSIIQEDHKLVLIEQNLQEMTDDFKILVQGVENRILVRHRGKIYPELLDAANKSIEAVLLARGWDLGADYVGAEDDNQLDITSTIKASVDKFSSKLPEEEKEKLFFACFDLFQNPDDTESQILALLGRVSFALQIIINKPSEAITHKSLLPEVIYLDSNVLMPAIVNGHPFQQAYSDALKRLSDACTSAGIPIYIAVADPFLTEIIFHRKLAVNEVASMSLEDPNQLYEHIQLHGAASNIFIFAYSSMVKKSGSKISFDEFLKENAPYTDITGLKNFIKKWGINDLALSFNEIEMQDYFKYYSELKQLYDREPEYQRKKTVLIENETRQLLKIKLDLDKGLRVLFVTMDNRLRRYATGSILGYPGSALINHNGLIQLIDLLIGFETSSASMARLLWGSFITDQKLVIINYFTNMALKEYDEAMAMSLPEVLNAMMPMIVEEARKEG